MPPRRFFSSPKLSSGCNFVAFMQLTAWNKTLLKTTAWKTNNLMETRKDSFCGIKAQIVLDIFFCYFDVIVNACHAIERAW